MYILCHGARSVNKSSPCSTRIPTGNQFVIFDDIPLFWDAWDVMEYHVETRKVGTDVLGV